MASLTKVELQRQGVRQLLKGAEVQADLARRAAAIANSAGPGVASDVQVGKTRARARVWTDTIEAKVAEARDRSLSAAMAAGR